MAVISNIPGVYNAIDDGGAAGNGIANDTAAINALIASVNAGGGGVVYFPRGTYLVDTVALKPDVSLVGAGGLTSEANSHGTPRSGISILKSHSAVPMLQLRANWSTTSYYSLGRIMDLWFEGNSVGTVGLDTAGLVWTAFHRCWWHGFTTGCVLDAGLYLSFYDCTWRQNITGAKATALSTVDGLANPNLISFTNCNLILNTHWGLDFDQNGLLSVKNCDLSECGTNGLTPSGSIRLTGVGGASANSALLALDINGAWCESQLGPYFLYIAPNASMATVAHINVRGLQADISPAPYVIYIDCTGNNKRVELQVDGCVMEANTDVIRMIGSTALCKASLGPGIYGNYLIDGDGTNVVTYGYGP